MLKTVHKIFCIMIFTYRIILKWNPNISLRMLPHFNLIAFPRYAIKEVEFFRHTFWEHSITGLRRAIILVRHYPNGKNPSNPAPISLEDCWKNKISFPVWNSNFANLFHKQNKLTRLYCPWNYSANLQTKSYDKHRRYNPIL